MEDREIRERARKISKAFDREETRTSGPMARFLKECRLIAREVCCGEYHRAGIFMRAVDALGDLGFDVSFADTDVGPRSETVGGAAGNAKEDVRALLVVAALQQSKHPRAHMVVNRADDLMQCIDGGMFCANLDACAERLHDAVTEWLDGGHGPLATGKCERLEADSIVLEGFSLFGPVSTREVPERVLFNPPATIAFWGDGTKTVAKCSEGDQFSEYVGLLVCIAKRHVRVPRRKTFEDVMARLLKRAERA